MAFADLTAQLNLNIANFSSNLSRAATQMDRFAYNMQSSYRSAADALKSHNLGLKDTARIVQGIMVSQAFYGIARSISDATKSLWDFNVALDYMNVTYSALFGSTDIAGNFMQVLQEHSINTIFSFQQLADASKKLLAYGIDYKNLMFIMEGLTNLGAMSGDAAALDRVALALGQIYTKGKLSAEEMRQLANAYIPITDILQERFGLTGDQLKRVSDLNLPAADVINAIVDYANDHFGAVGDAAMLTITGIQNKIVDTIKVVGTRMLKPITSAYKSFLVYISKGLEVLRGEFEAGGIGGVFEYLVPDKSAQQVIRQFVANLKNLFMSLVSVGVVVGQVFGSFVSVLMTAFNIAGPVIMGVVNALTGALNAMLNTRAGAFLLRTALLVAAGAFVVLRTQALYALVVAAVTKAITNLSKALLVLSGIITRHPIVMLIATIGLALIGIAASSDKAHAAISKLFGNLGGAFKGEDQLKRTEQELYNGANAAGEFDQRLSGATDSANDLTDALKGTGKAAKKTKGLLSFDEVFKLPEDTRSTSSGAGIGSGLIDALGDLTGAFDGLSGSLIPEIPDFGDFISGFMDNLFGGLDAAFVDNLANVGWGSLIGAALGGILGGLLGGAPGAALGIKIGALAGGLAGLLWETLGGAISNTAIGALAGIAAAISKGIGTSLFGALKSVFANGGGWSGVWSALSGALKTTGLKNIVKGGLIGAAIGFVVDGIASLLWNSLAEKFSSANTETAKVGQTIGSLIGAAIGGIFFGPVGAVVGSAIGTFAGGLVGLFWEPIVDWSVKTSETIGNWMVTTYSDINTWAVDTAAGFIKWAKDTDKAFLEWTSSVIPRINSWAEETIKGIDDWVTTTYGDINTWVATTANDFMAWVRDTNAAIAGWANDLGPRFKEWVTTTVKDIDDWAVKTYSDVDKWVNDTTNDFVKWAGDTNSAISEWSAELIPKFGSWVTTTSSNISKWATSTGSSFSKWVSDTNRGFNQWRSDAANSINTWSSDTLYSIGVWSSNALTSLQKWFTDTNTRWSTYWTNLGSSITRWLETKIWQPIADFFDIGNFWRRISSMLDGIYSKLSSWWDGVRSIFNRSINVNASVSTYGSVGRYGHASGGIFNREHVARFAEGNKAEAIIPLENDTAMQPFVNAVAGGLLQSLAPMLAQQPSGYNSDLPPMYVGTLIADDNGIKELYKKFRIIQVQENARRGTVGGL